MAKQVLPPKFRCLARFMLDFLFRRSTIRGCHIIWAALWRFLKKSLAVCPLRLRPSFTSLLPALHWKKSGCGRQGPSYSNAHVGLPYFRSSHPTEGMSVQRADSETVTASVRTWADDPDSEVLSIPSAHSVFPSSSSTSSNNDGSQGGFKNKEIFYPSESLNNIPMHPIPLEARTHSDVNPATPIAHTSHTVSFLGSIGSCGPGPLGLEIAEFIWPMMPTEIPRYKKTRVM